MRKSTSFSISEETIELIRQVSHESRITKTDLVEAAIADYAGRNSKNGQQSEFTSDTLSANSRTSLGNLTEQETEAVKAVLQMMRADDHEMWPMVQRAIKIWRMDHRDDDKTSGPKEDLKHRPAAAGRRRTA